MEPITLLIGAVAIGALLLGGKKTPAKAAPSGGGGGGYAGGGGGLPAPPVIDPKTGGRPEDVLAETLPEDYEDAERQAVQKDIAARIRAESNDLNAIAGMIAEWRSWANLGGLTATEQTELADLNAHLAGKAKAKYDRLMSISENAYNSADLLLGASQEFGALGPPFKTQSQNLYAKGRRIALNGELRQCDTLHKMLIDGGYSEADAKPAVDSCRATIRARFG